MTQKILFILHEDSQSGAPNALLSFLSYVKEKYPNDFIIDIFVLNSHGKLENELRAVARNFYKKQKKRTLLGKISKFFQPNLFRLQILNNYNVVYGNTVLSLKVLSKIKTKFNKIKTIIYVHEDQYMCSIHLNFQKSVEQFKQIDKIFTVAQSSANNLIQNYNVQSEKITIIHPTVKKETLPENNPLTSIYNEFDLVLANIGHPNLTKGTELIPQIASLLRSRNPKLKFKILVVGVLNDNEYIKAIKLDICKLNLENYIELIPHTNQPLDYLAVANAYIIPSREDSFSLMAVQAAIAKKPIIIFKNAVGVSEILTEDCTFQANYLDVEDFVKQIETIYNNPELSKQKTTLARKKYEEILDSQKINETHFKYLQNLLNN